MKKTLIPVFGRLAVFSFLLFAGVVIIRGGAGSDPLALPEIGSASLQVITPNLLELNLITTKAPPPARVTEWNFVAGNFQYALPAVGKFSVTVDGIPAVIQSVGFRRRPLYAAYRKRDLRIGNYLYLKLAVPIAEGQKVEVLNPDQTLWKPEAAKFTATLDPLRPSPAIHVNQQGYVPSFPKKAIIGYYAGTFGEVVIPSQEFKLINNAGATVSQGSLTLRIDKGYKFTPLPYQQVYEADFSGFTTPGEYRLSVPGLGVSAPFRIDEGAAAAFARTYALGLYHQRCGHANDLPYTRHIHGVCHAAPAEVPNDTYAAVKKSLLNLTGDSVQNPRQTAVRMTNINLSLYPFVTQGKVDVSGGHHDAGDYSKYTINAAQLAHALIFSVDNFPAVASLDNLGIPESGDRISDLLQEAKIELDFLARMQDADGGFYFLVYPKTRAYESNVLPDRGDTQVVFPKNTAATAAAAAALAQAASSPAFKSAYPEAAASCLAKALKGWDFLQRAFTKYGRDGSYQKVSHYGDEFLHDDEVAWAAAELFLATGDANFETELISKYNPNDRKFLRQGWKRLWEGYGAAVRSYAFGARSGRVAENRLNADYLAKCKAELIAGAGDSTRFSQATAYGASFPDPDKNSHTAGWFFAVDQTFDIATAAQLNSKPEYLDAIVRNMNYEGGANPVNVSFLTGIGLKRQREIVHQYAFNDRRILPPSGLPIGSIQSGFQSLELYPNELQGLAFPNDYAGSAPYAPYDIWADTYNVTTEFVNPQQGRSLGSMALLMGMTALKTQPWAVPPAGIKFVEDAVIAGKPASARIEAAGFDLAQAQIVWEGRSQEPTMGASLQFTPVFIGRYWVEAEAMFPDGRRISAASELISLANYTLHVSPSRVMTVSGPEGVSFSIEASADLQEWVAVLNSIFTTEPSDFVDEEASAEKMRFYRLIPQPSTEMPSSAGPSP